MKEYEIIYLDIYLRLLLIKNIRIELKKNINIKLKNKYSKNILSIIYLCIKLDQIDLNKIESIVGGWNGSVLFKSILPLSIQPASIKYGRENFDKLLKNILSNYDKHGIILENTKKNTYKDIFDFIINTVIPNGIDKEFLKYKDFKIYNIISDCVGDCLNKFYKLYEKNKKLEEEVNDLIESIKIDVELDNLSRIMDDIIRLETDNRMKSLLSQR